MLNIPYVRQSDIKRNCGAACLSMLLQYYRKKGTMSEITENISEIGSDGRPSCRNNLILKYAKSKEIPCCIVSVKDITTAIPVLLQKGIDVIISYRPNINSPDGHFSVVTGCNDSHVFVNDPQKGLPDGKDFPIPYEYLREAMKPLAGSPQNEITRENTLVLLANPIKEISLSFLSENISIFACIAPMLTGVLIENEHDGVWGNIQQRE